MRYCGEIGYFETVETKPGLFEQQLVFKRAKGDVIRNTKRNQLATSVNDNIVVNNSISVVADPYAREHFFAIKCIRWQGTLWNVSSVEVQYPRLILELGEPYHEDMERPTSDPSGNNGG